MPLNMIFRKSRNELEKGGRVPPVETEAAQEITEKCPGCGRMLPLSELAANRRVCPNCGHCFRMSARRRLDFLVDPGSFNELFSELTSTDLLGFPGYAEKLAGSRQAARETEAVICGTAQILGQPCALFLMEPFFMMGSMGTAVGEKITRLFEYATEARLPVVGCTVSGGARMQEGILSLMQMAKTSGAVGRHSAAGNFYLVVLADPTTGGVTASFAMQADIILAEPVATVGFAGARVIEQTVRKRLPSGFQKAEFLLAHGFIDAIVTRGEQQRLIARLLELHRREDAI